jgi:hypothetical protein
MNINYTKKAANFFFSICEMKCYLKYVILKFMNKCPSHNIEFFVIECFSQREFSCYKTLVYELNTIRIFV